LNFQDVFPGNMGVNLCSDQSADLKGNIHDIHCGKSNGLFQGHRFILQRKNSLINGFGKKSIRTALHSPDARFID